MGRWADVLLIGQPRGRQFAQADALAGAQPVQRQLVGSGRVLAGVHAAGLDLGEHERAPVEGDQVDLAVAGALVAPERGEAQAVEVGGGQLLPAPAERVTRVGALCIPARGVRAGRGGLCRAHVDHARPIGVTRGAHM